jgi:hypothetical protein
MADTDTLKKTIDDWKKYHANLLERYKTETLTVIQHYSEACDSPSDVMYWQLTLDFGQRYARMAVEWCNHALKTINQNDASFVQSEQKAGKTQGGTKHGATRGVRKSKKTG